MGHEVWEAAGAYEAYVGRWSRLVAQEFVGWLDVPAGHAWLDVGCGTGALTEAALATAPTRVLGVDRSPGFVAGARLSDPRVSFAVGDATAFPLVSGQFETVVSGLALNFVPDADRAVAECVRVAAPGAVVAAYVWDYADGMEMMRYFWDAAAEVDPAGQAVDEGRRFPLCRPGPLAELWRSAGLGRVETRAIEVPTTFTNFADFWSPFLGGQGAAPAYAATLTADRLTAVRELLRARVPREADGSIRLTARAWAVRGTVH